MFHSFGTVQSRTRVPDGTSCTSRGIRSPIRRSVSRIPSPVMLRQKGNNSAMKSDILEPISLRLEIQIQVAHVVLTDR